MTEEQKWAVNLYRSKNLGYKKISELTGISVNTIKSHCRKKGRNCADTFCLQCHKPVIQIQGRKLKKFCSDRCRMIWWNEHPDLVNRKAFYDFKCQTCGKRFKAYGNTHRKYCSRDCYLKDRYGRKEHAILITI